MATDQLFKYSLQDRILELIDTTTRYYYCSDIANTDHGVDLNLMLGISIMKGKVYPYGEVLHTYVTCCAGNEIIVILFRYENKTKWK